MAAPTIAIAKSIDTRRRGDVSFMGSNPPLVSEVVDSTRIPAGTKRDHCNIRQQPQRHKDTKDLAVTLCVFVSLWLLIRLLHGCVLIGCIEGGESLSIAHERFKQWSRCPVLAMLTSKFENAFVNLVNPDRVRVPHRAADIGRKAVAGNVDRVDVCGALSESLRKNARAFIDHDVDTSFDDFFIAYRPA